MPSIGSTTGLVCGMCGDYCVTPRTHLATQTNATSLLTPDTPCANYAEVNKWGRRWRVVEAFVSNEVRFFVDDMGEEDDFTVRLFAIPSAGSDVTEWNTVGECTDIAEWKHDPTTKRYERKQIPPATGQQWAEDLAEKHEWVNKWKRGASIFGPGGFTQRSTDWVR